AGKQSRKKNGSRRVGDHFDFSKWKAISKRNPISRDLCISTNRDDDDLSFHNSGRFSSSFVQGDNSLGQQMEPRDS
ncbi:unnamed protein product, partial [Ilex paraguariensis]